MSLVLWKIVGYNAWVGEPLYSLREDWWLNSAMLASTLLAVMMTGFAALLVAHWFSRRTEFQYAPPVTRRDVVRLPVFGVAWYLASFLLFFAVDGSFTRVGGTTVFCYARPPFTIYDPLWKVAWRLGFQGGNRYFADEVARSIRSG